MKKKACMQTVADEIGCTRMTVSLALRNDPVIPEQTRTRIRDMANKLGYRPNPLVSALMAQRAGRRGDGTGTVMGMLVYSRQARWWENNRYFGPMVHGFEKRAFELGYRTEAFMAASPDLPPKRLHKILTARNIRALMVLPMPPENKRAELPWEHYVAATMGTSLEYPQMDRVTGDSFKDTWTALEKIQTLGYERPGFVVPEETSFRNAHHYLAAFLAFQKITPRMAGVPPLITKQQKDAKLISTWVKKHRPDVIVGPNDLRDVLALLKLKCPEEIGLISLTDGNEATGLSGINDNTAIVGIRAAELLAAQLYRNAFGLPAHPSKLLVPGDWIEGKTTRHRQKTTRQ